MASEPDLTQRLSALSPERRALVEQMLRNRAKQSTSVPAKPVVQAAPLRLDVAGSDSEQKAKYRTFYDSVSLQLNGSAFGEFSVFLNYGYVANEARQYSPVELPEHFLNRNSVKLVLELVGDRPINDRDVLDIGCGRGGSLQVLAQFFRPRTLTGVDLSAEAIAFNQRTHRDARLSFYEGDAENLPFVGGSFDTIVNVESSHSYPRRSAFYREVWRTLRPGGWFLYTDLLPAEAWAEARHGLVALGFNLAHDRDITGNVLRSCDMIAGARMGAFGGGNDPSVMKEFLAVPGSSVYDGMANGSWEYRIFWLRRDAGAEESGGQR